MPRHNVIFDEGKKEVLEWRCLYYRPRWATFVSCFNSVQLMFFLFQQNKLWKLHLFEAAPYPIFIKSKWNTTRNVESPCLEAIRLEFSKIFKKWMSWQNALGMVWKFSGKPTFLVFWANLKNQNLRATNKLFGGFFQENDFLENSISACLEATGFRKNTKKNTKKHQNTL